MSTFDILVQYRPALLAGLLVTLKLCAIIWTAGLLIGTILGTFAVRYRRTLGGIQVGVSFVLSGIPILVFLFWAHYPLQELMGVVIDPFITAVVVLSIINIVAVSDTVRVVLADIPAQYVMAARACGLPTLTTWLRIRLPLTVRQLIPALLPIQIGMLHSTLFASLISVEELFRVTQRINSQIYRPIEIYSGLAVFFLAVSLPVNGFALWLRARFTRILSES